MKLILVVPTYFPDSYGGAERQAKILAEALGRRGVDVTIVAPALSPDTKLLEETSFGRIERCRLDAPPANGGRNIASFLRWTLWFRKRFGGAEHRGTPIYVFHAKLHAFGPALAARSAGAPFMIKLGGGGEASDFHALGNKKFLYGKLVRRALIAWTDAFVANGRQIVDDLRSFGVREDRIAIFANGVNLPSNEDVLRSIAERSGRRLLYAGRLLPDKRIDVLHAAAVQVATDDGAVEFNIFGEGPERARLLPLTPAHLADRIRFPGFVDDVYPHLSRTDFFVSTSLREGQSNALLEAMSAGVIPIVAAASGVRDVVADGVTGFVVDGERSEDFAATVRRALALPSESRMAMAQAAFDFARDNIGIDAVATLTQKAWTDAAVRKAKRPAAA